jgi:hypothetical protein
MTDAKVCIYCRGEISGQTEVIHSVFSMSATDHWPMGFRINGFFHPHCLRRYKNSSREEVISIRNDIQHFLMQTLRIMR